MSELINSGGMFSARSPKHNKRKKGYLGLLCLKLHKWDSQGGLLPSLLQHMGQLNVVGMSSTE
jgi:hypothetical protein